MAKKSYIYLASPYTSPDKKVQEDRFYQVVKITAAMSAKGEVVFSPIVHSHPLHVIAGLGGDWAFWSAIDYCFIDNCEKIVVAKMDGWDRSVGVKAEVEYAVSKGIPVEYMDVSEDRPSQS